MGSDGKDYPFLLKPDDDLRKDTRLMETAGLLNRLFAREPLSRRRNLFIRRYACRLQNTLPQLILRLTALIANLMKSTWLAAAIWPGRGEPMFDITQCLYSSLGCFGQHQSNLKRNVEVCKQSLPNRV